MNPPETSPPRPFEVAMLAAQLSPGKCLDPREQYKMAQTALSLLSAATKALSARQKQWPEKGSKEETFLSKYNVPLRSNSPFERAALIITGHIEDRHRSRALQKMKRLIESTAGDGAADHLLELRDQGVSWRNLLFLRTIAEEEKICRKKELTENMSSVRSEAANPRKKLRSPRKT